jgi:membrane-bound lytic murein transglycosylase D
MKFLKNILIFLLGATTVTTLLIFSSLSPDKDKETIENANLNLEAVQQIRIPKLPDSMNFAGEPIPMNDPDVRERIDREILAICFWHSNIIQNIKFSRRYFPIIEELSAKYGIPDDIKYLAVTESSLRNATSSVGAKGIWQFMSSTASAYDLLVNKEIDERLNFYKTTEAACKLLKNLKNKFGTWTLAAAAYNCGEGRVKERISEQGNQDYYHLVLPEETMRYVPRIAAMKEIMENPAKYGYKLSEEDYYPPFPKYKKIIINSSVKHWPDFCREQHISYRTLIVHNPWILGYSLTNPKSITFEILIPEQ